MEKRGPGGMEIRKEDKINNAEKNMAGVMKDHQKLTRIQMSETVLIGSLLALAGGFLDAYTYICRGGVFATAKTGNILLFSLPLCKMAWERALPSAIPVVAYAAGILRKELVRRRQ